MTNHSSEPATGHSGHTHHADLLLALAERLTSEATVVLSDGLQRAELVTDTKSSSTDLVTEVDRAAEKLIVEGILNERPDDSIVGEEGASRSGSTGVCWFIDPIDGTTNYVYGLPGYAVSIGVEVDGVPTAGVVAVPGFDETFTALRNKGAWRNGTAIAASRDVEPSHALVATGFAYEPRRRIAQATAMTKLIGRIRDIRRMGAASVDLCSVACGRVDAYYERGLQPWDHAAGALIASEAGATVAGLDRSEAPRDVGSGPSPLLLAASPPLWEQLAEMLGEVGAGQA